MRPTRRGWTLAGTTAVLLVVALLGARPLPLVGAASLVAFWLVAGVRAVSAFTTTRDRLTVEVSGYPERVPASGDATLSLSLSLEAPATHPVALDCSFPPGVSGDPTTLTVAPGEPSTRDLVAATFPIAGQFDVPDLRLTFTSPDGLFTQRLPLDERVTVTAEAHRTGPVHVGAGGDAIAGVFGTHRGGDGQTGGGDLSGLREYLPTDSVRRIDWNATARLDDVYVREYESVHERRTRLVVDARRHLTVGDPGERKIDYLREVALSLLRSTEETADPLGLTVVDDDGVRVATELSNTAHDYREVRSVLLGLGTTAPTVSEDPSSTPRSTATPALIGSETARVAHTRLATREDASSFASTLEPFFAHTGSYVELFAEDPLFAAIRRHVRDGSLGDWTVVLTDDTDRPRLREATRFATRDGRLATVFVAPDALFGPLDTSSSHADAHRAFVDFEEFRRLLDRLPRVTAYEVAQDDRLRAVLSQGRRRTRR
jgi:uncharacterized protein (DUF58 family)